MTYLPIVLGLAAGLSTYSGGILTWRFVRRRAFVFALTGGSMVGLALLDLLPTALRTGTGGSGAANIFPLVAAGFAAYLLLHRIRSTGTVGRMTLVTHSLIDGLGIGLAFQVSSVTGWLIAAGVLAHDLADGANMVGLSLTENSKRLHGWLLANAIAPLVGAAIGQAVAIDAHTFSEMLALFAGGFFYIGACEILPKSLGSASTWLNSFASVSGLIAMGCIAHLLP
ncbi:ZIP family metal transporter [Novosphingobium sp. BW1]|uniref:ZIP family metal transporter n=1 Tax=Novosphingobium sp. BW1 TaxID=2592621 RepID=UPI0011DE7814|nr:hypothetical protein [Novosphingobium sp. BW1]TYC79097.1 hypothetical protein FMM79_20475 [Novosphingobium sp. BW1]